MAKRATHLRFPTFLAFLALVSVLLPETALPQAQRVGGPCSYENYPGAISIIAVEPIPQPKNPSARLPYQPYRVIFTFAPAKPVPHPVFQPGKTQELTLSGGTPPGPEFLKRYGIHPGASFKTDLHLITSGTCSPVVFTFHGIDVFDRFEFKKH